MGWLKLSVLLLVTAAAGVGAGLGAHALIRNQPSRAASDPVVATIGGLPLVVPRAMSAAAASPPATG